jgi:signal transduction histidine kinase
VPSIVVALVLVLVLPWRRTRPLRSVAVAFGTITLVQLAAVARDVTWEGLFTMAVALVLPYSLCRWGSGRDVVLGLAIILVPTTIGIADQATTVGDAVGGVLVVGLAAAIGVAVRARQNARVRELDQVKLLEREQLARELHDTVAHHVSAIAVQAQAGRTLAGTRPAAALDALAVIEEEASRTLAEMRTMVGALRQGEEPDLRPQRGVTDIRRLAGGPDRGPRVEVELSGALDDLRPSVDAALYRLAQESVTNAVRHARQATRVDVSVDGDDEVVRLTVRDDGDVVVPATGAAAGFGLVGMAERAKLLGGSFEAGPSRERGWTVRAVLPKEGGRS